MRSMLFLLAAPLLAGSVRVYVANSGGNEITIVDPEQNKAVGSIRVSRSPHGLVTSPDGHRFYVSSEGEDLLDVVDRKSGRTLRRVPLGSRPNNLAITPDGRRVYICIRNASVVDIVDTASLEKVKSVEVGRNPHNVYCTPDGKHMIATSMGDRKLTVIDIASEKPEFEIPLEGIPRPVAIEAGADGRISRLFVQLSDLHGFVAVDYALRKTVQKVMLPDAPPGAKPLIPSTFSHGIAIEPGGKSLWVASTVGDSVSVFSLPDLHRLDTIKVGHAPDWMTFTPDGARCYVSNAGSDSVSAIDVRSRKELTRVPVGKVPKRLIAVAQPD